MSGRETSAAVGSRTSSGREAAGQPERQLLGGDLGPLVDASFTFPADVRWTTFRGAAQGVVGRQAPVANTSRPAPASRPAASASTRACSSTMAPRAVLTRIAPGAGGPASRGQQRWTRATAGG